jgi:hypothetical protein
MKRWLWIALLCGCSSGGSTGDTGVPPDSSKDLAVSQGSEDLAGTSADLGAAPDLRMTPDLAPAIPTDADCFTEWKTLGSCPAPQITDSYLGNNCMGTTGVFVVGRYFQSGNRFWTTNGFMPYGPYAQTSKLNRDTWNWLSPRLMCITTSADAAYWTGFAMQVKNPDGQLSNTVTVGNKLGSFPTLPSSGTTNPFDANACLDPVMTTAQAQARFAPAASTATLGPVTISRRSRPCNSISGCGAWGTTATEATTTAGLQVSGGTTIRVTLGPSDCGLLGPNGVITTNSCPTTGSAGSYEMHVAGSCLMLWQRRFSAVAGDGSYTQTDYGAVIKY